MPFIGEYNIGIDAVWGGSRWVGMQNATTSLGYAVVNYPWAGTREYEKALNPTPYDKVAAELASRQTNDDTL